MPIKLDYCFKMAAERNTTRRCLICCIAKNQCTILIIMTCHHIKMINRWNRVASFNDIIHSHKMQRKQIRARKPKSIPQFTEWISIDYHEHFRYTRKKSVVTNKCQYMSNEIFFAAAIIYDYYLYYLLTPIYSFLCYKKNYCIMKTVINFAWTKITTIWSLK